MSSTFTGASGSYVPVLIEGYEAKANSRNIEHKIPLGGSAYTLRAASLRRGRMKALFTSASNAQGLFSDLRAPASVALASTDLPYAAMTFLLDPNGQAELHLSASRAVWIVEFDWVEI